MAEVEKRNTRGRGSVLQEKGRDTFEAVIKIKGQRYRKTGLASEKAGWDWIDDLKQEHSASDGRVVAESKKLYSEWLDDWEVMLLRRVTRERFSETTYSSYRKNIRLHIRPHVGHLRVQDVGPAHLTELYDKLLAEGSPGGQGPLGLRTVAYIHTIIRASFRDALTLPVPLRRTNPCDLIAKDDVPRPPVKADQGDYDIFEPGQILAFMHRYADHRLTALWWLYFTRGARRGELLALRWPKVNLDAGYLEIVKNRVVVAKAGGGNEIIERNCAKGGKGRVVPLDPFLIKVLRAHRERQLQERAQLAAEGRWEDTDYVFTSDGVVGHAHSGMAGGPLHPDHLTRTFQRLIAKYNKQHPDTPLPMIRLHDTRHTTATHLILSGVDENIVAELLGHSSSVVTRSLYTHVSRKRAAIAAAAFTTQILGPEAVAEPEAQPTLRLVKEEPA